MKKIGEGKTSTVYEVELNSKKRVIKKINLVFGKYNLRNKNKLDFEKRIKFNEWREVEVLKELQKYRNYKNGNFIIKYYGYLQKNNFLYIIMDKFNETLIEYLLNNPEKQIEWWNNQKKCFDFCKKYKIIHNDLHLKNILYNKNYKENKENKFIWIDWRRGQIKNIHKNDYKEKLKYNYDEIYLLSKLYFIKDKLNLKIQNIINQVIKEKPIYKIDRGGEYINYPKLNKSYWIYL